MNAAEFIFATLDPAAPVPDGIVGAQGEPTTKRFNVYRNNVVVGLKDALKSGFPAVTALVGEDFFDAMAGAFVREYPPRSPFMPLYGDAFAEFIAGFAPAASLPYLADVARLEYALRVAYHAADATAVSAETLADPKALTRAVKLAPALACVTSAYPVTAIHRAALGGSKPVGGAEDVVITRPGFDPMATAFPAGTADVIRALRDGKSLQDAASLAPDRLDLTAFLGCLVSGGAIVHLEET
ncbi:DNA-binding domain-containing protein [Celeribacter arenosi]|uniref:DNA-binding domain-containing protein n=1 Tax=Celeribacter arenosi TaxID=792649 RepID=A0ABP7KBZ1_9RHOB